MSNYKTAFAWLASVLVLAGATGLYASLGGKAHLMDQKCSFCHLSGQAVDPAQASRLIGSQEMLCGVCHKDVKRMSHPSGFTPQRPLPAGMPLDWKGDMTCSTCHEVHGSQAGLVRGDKKGKALCLSCHDRQFFANMKDAGASLHQSGHAVSSLALSQPAFGIDALSLQCMGCHIERSDAAGVRIGSNGIVRHNSGGANHPIGAAYPSVPGGGGFHPKSALPKEVWLPDGKLSCVSCHQPYKKEHGKLVGTNDSSSLCTICHNL